MYKNFLENVVRILKGAEEERYKLKHPYVGTEHLLLSILRLDNEMANYLKKFNLTYTSLKKELELIVGTSSKTSGIVLYTPMLKRVINNAMDNAKEDNQGIVSTRHLFLSVLEEGEGIGIRLLIGMNIDIDKIYDDLSKNSKMSSKNLELFEVGSILNELVDDNEIVVGRDKEIDLIIETLLRKKKNNPILIGDAGVGKTAIVEELTRRIKRKEVPEILFDYKIVSLEMGSLVSGTKYRGEFEEKLTKIIKELENNSNIILFIDEIHSMVNAGGAEGAITAGDIFKPALARGKIKCIGATTKDEYLKHFSFDKALMRRFEVINIDEPTKEETKNILLKVKKEYEHHHNVIITDEIIEKIIYYTDNFIVNKKFPDKAIDFLDSVCSKVNANNNQSIKKRNLYEKLKELNNIKNKCIKNNDYDNALNIYNEENSINKELKKITNNKKKIVREKDILNVLENKINIILTKDKLNILDNYKKDVNKKLFNMNKYVNTINKLVKNNIINKKGFLKIYLLGSEYLGKSSLVKIFADNYPKANFVKIDLKEFQSNGDINRLIGTTQGYIGYSDKHLFSNINNNCFTIILFDNYKYAHQNVKDLIKEILKEKYIIDNKGEKICFNNTFIFITDDIINNSKVGFENINNYEKYNELNDLVDYTIVFDNLDKNTLIKYLKSKKATNIEYIIKESNYEKENYKKIDKLIKENLLINS